MSHEYPEQDPEEEKTFLEGLNTFYTMKSKYEEKIMDHKKEIIGLPKLSWREKRTRYKQFKPKCIHCGKTGGTLFFSGYDEKDDERKLIARCGNKERPCPLNIVIHLGNIYRVDETLLEDEKDIEGFKRQVIRDKNDLLFGYINTNEALERFEELKTNIKDVNDVYEYALQHYYLDKIENPETKKRVKELNVEIPEQIKDLKKLVEDYEKSPNENAQNILDATTLYVETIRPNTEELRKLMYPVEYVEVVPDDNTTHLIQRFVHVRDLEQNLGGKWGVEKMVLTVEPGQRQTLASVITSGRTKTNKIARPKKANVKTMKRRALTQVEEPVSVEESSPSPSPQNSSNERPSTAS